MAFIETQFPLHIAYGSTGGPEYSTSVVPLDNGSEQRLARWPVGRHRFDAAGGIKTQADYNDVLAMFHACQGRAHGFRWKDHADYRTADTITFSDSELVDVDGAADVGDGTTTVFYLAKKYIFGSTTVYRPITKPVNGTVLIAVNGVLQTETTHYTIDYTTGAVTFVTAPPNTHSVTNGCEFDVPARFDTDHLPARLASRHGQQLLIDFDIPVLELKL